MPKVDVRLGEQKVGPGNTCRCWLAEAVEEAVGPADGFEAESSQDWSRVLSGADGERGSAACNGDIPARAYECPVDTAASPVFTG